MKVLNLYAGIGGNRKLWTDVEVTAVEWDESIAGIYQNFFPDDKVIVADAHQYLLEHYKEYDFIWSSPPCPSHSRARFWGWRNTKPMFPDMKLYEEVLFLDNYYDGKYCVENVKSYYKPLIPPQELGRHYFWTNFIIKNTVKDKPNSIWYGAINVLQDETGFDLSSYSGIDKRKTLRNVCEPELGKIILECAFVEPQKNLLDYHSIG